MSVHTNADRVSSEDVGGCPPGLKRGGKRPEKTKEINQTTCDRDVGAKPKNFFRPASLPVVAMEFADNKDLCLPSSKSTLASVITNDSPSSTQKDATDTDSEQFLSKLAIGPLDIQNNCHWTLPQDAVERFERGKKPENQEYLVKLPHQETAFGTLKAFFDESCRMQCDIKLEAEVYSIVP